MLMITVIKINFTCFCLNVATRRLEITHVTHTVFLLNSAALEWLPNHAQRQPSLEVAPHCHPWVQEGVTLDILPHRKGQANTSNSLLSHCYSHVVGHGPIYPIHTETAQNKQLLEKGDVVIITQGEWKLLKWIQVIPLGKAKNIHAGVNWEMI